MVDEEVGEQFVEDMFQKLLGSKIVRIALIVIIVGAFAAVLGYFVYNVIPKAIH